MEQRVEVFKGHVNPTKPTSAYDQAKAKSDELATEGWFIHDTSATCWMAIRQNPYSERVNERVMITYRRKA